MIIYFFGVRTYIMPSRSYSSDVMNDDLSSFESFNFNLCKHAVM